MSSENQNITLHDANRAIGEQIESMDQSKEFFGGKYHPWRRLFARSVDIYTSGVAVLILFTGVLGGLMPEQSSIFVNALDNQVFASVAINFIWVPAEALLLSIFGTTPAKWIFGIRVTRRNGELMNVSEALSRSFLVFIQGVGLCIPIVLLFTHFFAYRRLTKTGTTLWDTSANSMVLHKKWGAFRALGCTAAVITVLIWMSALNGTGNG